MKVRSPFLLSCLWGTLCGAALGAFRTRAAALHLLEKGRALEAQGIPSLPGPSHWGVLQSPAPAGAGALFFGLSVGLGFGALAALWVRLAGGELPRGRLRWLCLAVPLWALWRGDAWLALALLAIAAGACLLPRSECEAPPLLVVACACVAAAGLLPWARAPEGPFSRLRDRVLLSTSSGLAIDRFYYRWTLYPAEALKPLDALTQPTAAVLSPGNGAAAFCPAAVPFGVLCVPGPAPGADFTVEPSPSGPVLASGDRRIVWPPEERDRRAAWTRFCDLTDRAAPLRHATAFALFTACPVGLSWALGSLCVWAGARALPRHPRAASLAAAALVALAVGVAGRPDPALDALRARAVGREDPTGAHLREALVSPAPAQRLYGVRAAPALGPDAVRLLLGALDDPVVNVRYAAAESLGRTGGTGVEARLVGILRGGDEWYVKERAYGALRRLGWRPRRT